MKKITILVSALTNLFRNIKSPFKKLFKELRLRWVRGKQVGKLKHELIKKLEHEKSRILKHGKKVNIQNIVTEFKSEFNELLIEKINIPSFFYILNKIIAQSDDYEYSVTKHFSEYSSTLESRLYKFLKSGKSNNLYYDISTGEYSIMDSKEYQEQKRLLQVELLKMQEWAVKNKKKIAIAFEGRDAAGKGSNIKRFIEYLNPAHFKVVALGIPTEEEKNNWFGRYEKYIPKKKGLVFYDRSWYNRAVVEPAMGYCTEEQYRYFMDNVNQWEESLIDDDVILIKMWFSVNNKKQLQRFNNRKKSPLKYWKYSENDMLSRNKWEIFTNYKEQMFDKTSTEKAPWVIINANDKRVARLNSLRYVLSQVDYDDKNIELSVPDPEVVHKIS